MIVASRYAKSLLDLAVEKGQLEAVYKDMIQVKNVCATSHDFTSFLNSPIIKTDKKVNTITAVFTETLSALSIQFLTIITNKRRESYIPKIAEAFVTQYKQHKKILTAVITSAVGLDATSKAKALELIKTQAQGEVELIEKVDPNVIGGFVLRIGDKQLDKTVARQLANLKKNFSENPYVREF